MEQIELRVLDSNLTVNEEEMIVEGLVNRTESWSHTLGHRKRFREKIEKGVFTRAIESSERIDFLGEHRTDMLLATTENGSLELWEDEEGLKMRAKIAPTSYGKDLFVLMKNKMVNHMSFGFRALSDKWNKLADGTFERSIDNLMLKEVSVVRNPAYPQSAIAARGIDVVEDVEIPADVEERTEENVQEVVEVQPTAPEVVAAPQAIAQSLKVEIDGSQIAEMFAQFKTELLESLKPQQTVEVPAVQVANTETVTAATIATTSISADKISTGVIDTSAITIDNSGNVAVSGTVVSEQKQEPKQEEVKPEQVDNSKGVVDLLAKYKQLQSFK